MKTKFTNDFNVYEIYEIRNENKARFIEFESDNLSIDGLIVFNISSGLEEGGCKEEILRIIYAVKLSVKIAGIWDKEGSKVVKTNDEKKELSILLFDSLKEDISDQFNDIKIELN